MEKNIRTLIVLTSAFLIADMAIVKAADSNNPPTPINPPREIIIKSWKNPTSLRPKAPTRQQIECTYADGSLYFLFAIPEGECQLSMTDLSTGVNISGTDRRHIPTSRSSSIAVRLPNSCMSPRHASKNVRDRSVKNSGYRILCRPYAVPQDSV